MKQLHYYVAALYLGAIPQFTLQAQQTDNTVDIIRTGKEVYQFYCYQCHSYRGDAQTLASTFLDPKPRDFTDADPEILTYDTMVDAVTNGTNGSAMVSFSSVISDEEIKSVVIYIREKLMKNTNISLIYHTKENGWPNHQRYKIAFPFASGELPLDTPWEQLTTEQQSGKRLFMQSCISCHDRAVVKDEGEIWQLRPLSYPRKHYNNRMPVDTVTGASPYALHDILPDINNLSEQQKRGAQLFIDNCAFCHGADGSGKNWIGVFIEPKARDLTSDEIKQRPDSVLKNSIKFGLENTSMPAWNNVLTDENIEDIITYIKK